MNNNKFLRDYTEKVYSIEQAREESLITQSGRMITVQGLSLTILSFLATAYKDNPLLPDNKLGTTLVFILISLIVSVLVQFRFPKLSFPKVKEIEKEFNNHSELKNIADDNVDEIYFIFTNKINNWLRVINNLRSYLIIISMIVFIVGITYLTANIIKAI